MYVFAVTAVFLPSDSSDGAFRLYLLDVSIDETLNFSSLSGSRAPLGVLE